MPYPVLVVSVTIKEARQFMWPKNYPKLPMKSVQQKDANTGMSENLRRKAYDKVANRLVLSYSITG